MKPVFYILLSLLLMACTSGSQKSLREDETVEIYISPQIDNYKSLNAANEATLFTSITDNDGNIYNTFWLKSSLGNEAFTQAADHCREKLRGQRYFPGQVDISKALVSDFQPVNYKPYVSCIYDYGFELSSSEAFTPLKFHVSMHRTASLTDIYMPVGAVLEVSRPQTELLALYLDLKACQQHLLSLDESTMVETYFKGTTYVNLEPFAQGLLECLEQKFYSVTLLSANSSKEKKPIVNNHHVDADETTENINLQLKELDIEIPRGALLN
jgi:hypothetical protein